MLLRIASALGVPLLELGIGAGSAESAVVAGAGLDGRLWEVAVLACPPYATHKAVERKFRLVKAVLCLPPQMEEPQADLLEQLAETYCGKPLAEIDLQRRSEVGELESHGSSNEHKSSG